MAGLFDSLSFNPQDDTIQGLLARLLPSATAQIGQSQGFNPSGQTPDYGQAQNVAIGDYQMPVFGQAAPQAPTDVSARAMTPQAAPQQSEPSFLQQAASGLGDRLMAGFQGFANGGAPLPALANLVNGLATGRTPENQTKQFLVSRGVDPNLADTIVNDKALLRAVVPQMMGATGQTSDIKEYEYAKRQGFTGGLADWMARKRAGAGEFGMTPIYGTMADGKPGIMQLGKNGTPQMVPLPEGFQIARDPIKVDGPTGTTILDPQTRQQVGFIPKDVRGAEVEKAEGKSRGEAISEYRSIASKMPGLEKVVKDLDDLSNRATYTIPGQVLDYGMRQAGMAPRDAALARAEYISKVDNQILPLLRDTFGAQFTEREGSTLRQTLGDPDKSPQEKQAVLRSFIEQKRRDVEALASRAGVTTQDSGVVAQSAQSAPRVRKFNPETGKIE